MPRILLLAASVALLAGCVANPNRPVEISTPPERIVQQGYSFLPLDESGWGIAERTPYQIGIGKFGSSADETYAIQASYFMTPEFATVEEFAAIVKQQTEQDIDPDNPDRYQIIKNDAEGNLSRGTPCVDSHFRVRDNKAAKRTALADPMILEVIAVSCVHPYNKQAALNIGYSQRYYEGQRDAQLEEKAARLFESLEFLPIEE